MSGDICGHHDWEAPGIEWVGAGRLLHTLQCPGWFPTENDLATNVNAVKKTNRNKTYPRDTKHRLEPAAPCKDPQ